MGISKEEVANYLTDVKKAVTEKRYTVAPREKNDRLFEKFVFSEKQREDILMSLEVEDFCEVLNNEHPQYSHEKLYVFGKDIWLLPRYGGNEKVVSLYIKFNMIENVYCIVVSFHEQGYLLRYAFK